MGAPKRSGFVICSTRTLRAARTAICLPLLFVDEAEQKLQVNYEADQTRLVMNRDAIRHPGVTSLARVGQIS